MRANVNYEFSFSDKLKVKTSFNVQGGETLKIHEVESNWFLIKQTKYTEFRVKLWAEKSVKRMFFCFFY